MSSSSVDPQVLEAAQAICMLAQGDGQQQDMTGGAIGLQEDHGCPSTSVHPVVNHEQGGNRERNAMSVRVTRPRRGASHRYHPYMRTAPQQIPANLFVDRPRMLHDPNLGREWVGRAEQLVRETSSSLSRAEEHHDMWQSPFFRRQTREPQSPSPTVIETQAPVPSSQAEAASGTNPQNDCPYTARSLCLQAFLAVPEGEWMCFNDVMEYLHGKNPKLKEQMHRVSEMNRTSRFYSILARLVSGGLLEKSRQPKMPVSWRISAAQRHLANSKAWELVNW
ncbi:hypothetical protein DHEL01_v201310 [Diaporthe helianthi]|uniref:Uncharacterized protein n=1 Tax=Diaporthe helianthi TaxID=158607 RepID=A0A2P5ICP3_DIAHE|nr:hypothetical protein DHEL01_v201310 [Diaporthe helianthi]